MARLNLDNLGPRLGSGLTVAKGGALAEAAAVCLESQSHRPGVTLEVGGDKSDAHSLHWSQATSSTYASNNDEQCATEDGAYGVAMLIVCEQTGKQVVGRARKGGGFDWWLGDGAGNQPLPFQGSSRLEVSGIRCGDASVIQRRVETKLKQISKSDPLGIPGFVAVVEFGTPCAHVVKK